VIAPSGAIPNSPHFGGAFFGRDQVTLALIGLISAMLGTCFAVFAIGVALAFRPGEKDKPETTSRAWDGLDFDKLTPEERRRVFDG
jgi:hypothetical protein